ncbi:MAG: hypothetical protein FWD36_02300 [Treponema sp.]|nr:hypothetical protein [Treponema sp.]
MIVQKTLLVLLFLAVVFSGCSRAEPKIAFGFIQLVYYQDKNKPQEYFSFFIIPEDDDGLENLEDLYLYHDREQLRWHIKSDDWISYTHEEKTWIGSRSIAIGEDEILPRGQYRAVLVNKGGEKSERNFSFDAPEEPRFPFPNLEISGGSYTVTSSYPVNRLVCYDEQGKYVFTARLDTLSGSVNDLNIPAPARTAALWAEDAEYFMSAYTDVTALR